MSTPRLTRLVILLALSVAATTQLTACFPLIAAGAISTSLAATDRRTLGTQLEDRSIQIKAESQIEQAMKGEHVNVTTFNRKILLTGEAPTEELRKTAEKIAAAIENVEAVVNELEVGPPSSLGTRSRDTITTGKVKATFVDSKDVFANAFKVVTERDVVYLMGRVTKAEGDRAADVASRVSGVAKVVKVLDLITEEELKALSTKPADAPAK